MKKRRQKLKILDILLELLYPKRCPFCHEILPREDMEICPDCLSYVRKYYRIRPPFCLLCGRESEDDSLYCEECRRRRPSFDRGFSLFHYGRRNTKPLMGKKPGFERHSMGESVRDFKFKHAKSYAGFYIDELVEAYGEELRKLSIDLIVPVPVHQRRKRERGYNQAYVLADLLGKAMGIPVSDDLLIRSQVTRDQKKLNRSERMRNLSKVFSVTGKVPSKVKNILLIDDIYTTGSTMETCTRKLKQAGAKKVYCVSICSGHI